MLNSCTVTMVTTGTQTHGSFIPVLWKKTLEECGQDISDELMVFEQGNPNKDVDNEIGVYHQFVIVSDSKPEKVQKTETSDLGIDSRLIGHNVIDCSADYVQGLKTEFVDENEEYSRITKNGLYSERLAKTKNTKEENNERENKKESEELNKSRVNKTSVDLVVAKITSMSDTENLTCNICGKIFPRHRNYEKHLRSHKEPPNKGETDDRVKCDICGKRYKDQKNFKQHLRRMHSGKKKVVHICNICGKEVTQLWNFNKHLKSHNQDCFLPEDLNTQSKMSYIEDTGSFEDSLQGDGKKNEFDTDATIAIDADDNINNYSSTEEHNSNSSENEAAFDNSERTLDNADRTLDNAEKAFCNVERTLDNADGTLDNAESKLDSADGTLDNAKLQLDNADGTLDNADTTFDNAKRTFDNADETSIENRQSKLKDKSGKHLCRICGKEFLYKFKLKLHYRLVHSSIKYRCNICGKGYIDRAFFNKHKKKHISEDTEESPQVTKRHKCKYCEMTFSLISNLNRHEIFHKDDETTSNSHNENGITTDREMDTSDDISGISKKPEAVNSIKTEKFRKRHRISDLSSLLNISYVIRDHDILVCKASNQVSQEKTRGENSVQSGAEEMNMDGNEEGMTDKPFKCKYCKRSFKIRSYLQSHEITHIAKSQNLRLKCSICNRNFKNMGRMNSHFKNSHSDIKPYKCNICGKAFGHKGNYDCHYQTHNKELGLPCKFCGKTYSRSDRLNAHIRQCPLRDDFSSVTEEFKCKCCGRIFVNKINLVKHESRMNVLKDVQHRCLVCSKKFKSAGKVNAHIREVHSKNRPFQCFECGKCFATNSILNSHLRRHTDSTSLPFLCSFCPKRFSNKYSCNRHEQTHTSTGCKELIKKERDFCNICNKWIVKSFFHRHSLKHMGLQIKTHLCTICNKQFASKYNLEIHKRLHMREKPFSCDHCSKSFVTKSSLVRHLKFHAGFKREAKFPCEICGKMFTLNHRRKRHQLRHKEYAAFECVYCRVRFYSQEELHTHLISSELCSARLFSNVTMAANCSNVQVELVGKECRVAVTDPE